MTDRVAVVTCFLHDRGEVLLCRRADDAETYPGRWAAVTGYVEEDDPEGTAVMEVREETGIRSPTLVRTGEPFSFEDPDLNREWTVHPFLFSVADRTVDPNPELATCEWTPPTVILDRETVPRLWTSYQRVAPTVGTVVDDETHGAAAISIRALEVLRDGAAVARSEGDGLDPVVDLAERLLAARPSMVVLRNRVNRAMAGSESPGAVEEAAIAGIERAYEVDAAAAREAASGLERADVITLSRSGTVLEALRTGDLSHVIVAESRPGREGVGVAETLAAADVSVTLCTDAAIAHVLAEHRLDAVLVGADAIGSDGTVVNKTGTRAAALAAAHEDVPFHVVAATDKISAGDTLSLEAGDPDAVYDGEASLTAINPTFDRTPPALVDAVVTERGRLDPEAIGDVAAEHAARRGW